MSNFLSGLKKSPLSWFLLLLLLIALLVYRFCCGEVPKKGPLVDIKGPILAPHAVSFLNVNGGASNVKNVRVTLIDSAGMVVSSNGVSLSTLEVSGGVMSIGLDPKASFSREKPYRFFIRAEADGYMPNFRPVAITDNGPNYIPIYMLSLESPPSSGLSSAVNTIAAVNNGVLQNTQEIATNRFGLGELPPLTIRMKEGTRMLCDGKPVEVQGPLNYQLTFGIPRDSNANRVFPGGFEVTDAVDEKGNRLNWPNDPAFFTTAGWFSMQMNIGGTGVNGFSKPLDVTMPIRKGTVNPENQKPVEKGSVIPLWSVDERTGVWKKEGQVTVEEDANGLVGRFSVSHLSTYNIDYKGVQCTGTITITNPGPAITGQKYTRFVDRATGDDIKTKMYDFDASTFPIEIIRFPATGNNHRLLIHNSSDPYDAVGRSSDDVGCGALNGTMGNGPGSGTQTLRFIQGGGTAIFCNNALWYRGIGGGTPFSLGGIINTSGELNHSISGIRDMALWFYTPGMSPQEAVLTFEIDFNTPPSASFTSVNYTYRVGAAPDVTGIDLGYRMDSATGILFVRIPAAVATGVCPVPVID